MCLEAGHTNSETGITHLSVSTCSLAFKGISCYDPELDYQNLSRTSNNSIIVVYHMNITAVMLFDFAIWTSQVQRSLFNLKLYTQKCVL